MALKFSVRDRLKKFLTVFVQWYLKKHTVDIGNHLRLRSLDSTCIYIEKNMVGVKMYENKLSALNHALKEVTIEGSYSEFGVFEGKSVNHIARNVSQEVHAYDSFEGLPETWLSSHEAGHFAVDKLPFFEKNVVVHKGWFNHTIPEFKKINNQNIAFLHIDCDLYSSTQTIFEMLGERIVENTIIIFDEYFNYPFWEHHEYKAFQEFVKANNITYKYICYSSNTFGSKVAVKILKKDKTA